MLSFLEIHTLISGDKLMQTIIAHRKPTLQKMKEKHILKGKTRVEKGTMEQCLAYFNINVKENNSLTYQRIVKFLTVTHDG